MAYNNINQLFGAWRAQRTTSTFSFDQQVAANRFRQGLSVKEQIKLTKKGANKKVMLGQNYDPKFIRPRGRAWIKVAELSGL